MASRVIFTNAAPTPESGRSDSEMVGNPADALPLATLICCAVPVIVAGRVPVTLPLLSLLIASSEPAPESGTSSSPIVGLPASPSGLAMSMPVPSCSVRSAHSPSFFRTANPAPISAASF